MERSNQRNMWDGSFHVSLVAIELFHDDFSSNNIIDPGCVVTIIDNYRLATFKGSGHLVSMKYDRNCYFELPYNEDISLLLEILEKPNKFLASCALTTYDLNELCPDDDFSYSKWVHLNSNGRLLIQIEYHSSDDLAIAFPSCTPKLENVIHSHALKRDHSKKSHESKVQRIIAAFSRKPILYIICKKLLWSDDWPIPGPSGLQQAGTRRSEERAIECTDAAGKIMRYRSYSIEDFKILKVLGRGNFGKVLLATLKNTNLFFAMKALKKDVLLREDDVESATIEKKVLMMGTRHPFICKLYCSFQTESYLLYVMEYLNGGDLMFHIKNGPFELGRAVFYSAEIISALKYLHRMGIIYRDVKSGNVALDSDGHIRLIDFGLASLMDRAKRRCGTRPFMAPEVILNAEIYNQAVDWWSFGVLLYEMLSRRSPFCGTTEEELFWSICNEEPKYPNYLTKESVDILKLLLTKDSKKRLGSPTCPAGDIKDQPFFKGIEWAKIERKEVAPPFKPKIKNAYDCRNFERDFTELEAKLSPVPPTTLETIDQDAFAGFTYTNPVITGN